MDQVAKSDAMLAVELLYSTLSPQQQAKPGVKEAYDTAFIACRDMLAAKEACKEPAPAQEIPESECVIDQGPAINPEAPVDPVVPDVDDTPPPSEEQEVPGDPQTAPEGPQAPEDQDL